MVQTITSNHFVTKSIYGETDNFVIVHFHQEVNNFTAKTTLKNVFDIYIDGSKDLCDLVPDGNDYLKSTSTNQYNIRAMGSVEDAMTEIVYQLYSEDVKAKGMRLHLNDDDPDPISINLAMATPGLNVLVKSYLEKKFKTNLIDVKVTDLYRSTHLISIDKLGSVISSILGAGTVDVNDPVLFSYALNRALQGG